MAFTGNSVVTVSAYDFGHTDVTVLCCGVEKSRDNGNRAFSAEVNVSSGVTAEQAAYLYHDGRISLG